MLRYTKEMKRKIEREERFKKKGIILPGEPIVFSDYFIKNISGVTDKDLIKDQIKFYYAAYRPIEIEKMTILSMEFDYYGKARKIHEIERWPGIEAAITRIICSPYILKMETKNYRRQPDGCYKVKIGYKISKNPEPLIKEKIKPVSSPTHITKKGVIPKKDKGEKNG